MQFVKENFLKKYFNVSILNVDVNIKYSSTQFVNSELIIQDFTTRLKNLQGNQNTNDAYSFNELVYSAAAYFFNSIYGTTTKNETFIKHNIKDSYYNIKYIKSCFDSCNYTSFVPIERIVTDYKELSNAPFYKECYLVIQTAYFLGTRFGAHQFLEYTEHFATFGTKLDSNLYKYDLDVLNKKYEDIAEDKKKHINSISSYLKNWYYSTLEIILNECFVINSNFRQTEKNGHFRVYNSLAQCPRTLRKEQAFYMHQCDISSAFPTMIGQEVKSNLGKNIYDNLATKQNISRQQAKGLFNTALNSAKYRKTIQAQNKYKKMLTDCGYTNEQSEYIFENITDSKYFKFFDWASKKEQTIINKFKKLNNINNGTRVHDAIYFIHDCTKNYSELITNIDGYVLNFEAINTPILNNTFYNSNRFLKKHNFSFCPSKIGLVSTWSEKKPNNEIGRFKGVLDVVLNEGQFIIKNNIETSLEIRKSVSLDITFFKEDYNFLNANFITQKFVGIGEDKKVKINLFESYNDFMQQLFESFSILKTLNKETEITVVHMFEIINRYRKYSNICFDVFSVLNDIKSIVFEDLKKEALKDYYKQRNWILNTSTSIDNDFVFNIALNKAKAIVYERYHINKILEFYNGAEFETINFLKPETIGISRFNKRMKTLINELNVLCSGSKNYKKVSKMQNLWDTYDKYNRSITQILRKANKIKKTTQRKTEFLKEIKSIKQQQTKIITSIQNKKDKFKLILEYLEPTTRNKINKQSEHYKEVIDLLKDYNLTPIKTKEVILEVTRDSIEINTDLRHSIYFHKMPKIECYKGRKALFGYELDFYKFHQHNWKEVLKEITANNSLKYYERNTKRKEIKTFSLLSNIEQQEMKKGA
jgi:hypothetical protein